MPFSINELRVARVKALRDMLFFVRFFFMLRYKKKFVIGDHHRLICETLDKVFKGDIKRLIINIAPRYGKTELAVINFIAMGLALNPAAKFIHLSYSDDLALVNSEQIKDLVESDEYQAMFPVKLRPDTKSKKRWITEQGGGLYATSTGGQVTGFGAGEVEQEKQDGEALDEWLDEIESKQGFAGAIVIDDPIKPEDADSEIVRGRINLRYDSTISNRVNSRNTPIILIMQRLHEYDLAGHLIENEPDEWSQLVLPSIIDYKQPTERALWPTKHTLEELKALQAKNEIIFDRQHMQNPKPVSGLMYKTLREYEELPEGASAVRGVCDTADEGADFLCGIIYAAYKTGYYILDVLYTDKAMEITEPQLAAMVSQQRCREMAIESNNGGRSFCRNVERICRENGNKATSFFWFHQSQNKYSRIFTQSAEVQNMIYFPKDWQHRWPLFYKAVTGYMAKGTNAHDDGPDALTMIIEAEKLGNYQVLTS